VIYPDIIGDTLPFHSDGTDYAPSRKWSHGGPIIERERITIDAGQHGRLWVARKGAHETTGPTPLVAAMRCYVASQLGDEVDLPEELADATS
jgi:hypothetical protein